VGACANNRGDENSISRKIGTIFGIGFIHGLSKSFKIITMNL